MQIVCISDTHRFHKFDVPDGDILIHAGDVSKRGEEWEIKDFLKWFQKFPHKYKIFIAGNHDFCLQNKSDEIRKLVMDSSKGVHYLEDSWISINGIVIYGSPWQPWFYDWAFNFKKNGPGEREAQTKWDEIPYDTNILITHGPAYEILDKNEFGENCGCKQLYQKVKTLDYLKYHICGHLHESYGMRELYFNDKVKTFINASVLDEKYNFKNQPVVLEY